LEVTDMRQTTIMPRLWDVARPTHQAIGSPDLSSARTGTSPSQGPLLSGTLRFDCRTSLGDFTGETEVMCGEVSIGLTPGEVQGWAEAPVMTLATGRAGRDADLRKVMEVEDFPVLRFELDCLTPTAVAGDTVMVILNGRFIIHGVSREADLPAHMLFFHGGARVWGDTSLDLSDYGIGGLRRLLGLLRVHQEVRVQFDLTFATGPGALKAIG
jgi:polyisoprenoid-binding protein YceI